MPPHRPDPSRMLYAACISFLDCIFIDGHGDAGFLTHTQSNVTELLRADPATRSLYTVAVVQWPQNRGSEPQVTALDLRKHPPGVIPPLRQISAQTQRSQWFHTLLTGGKDQYERYQTKSGGVVQRSSIMRRRKRTSMTAGLSLFGIDTTAGTKEQTCEIQLTSNGYLRDDTDIVLASVLLLCGGRDWRMVQSQLTKDQLEGCISVPKLKMNQKWDDASDSHEEDDVLG